MSGNAVNPSSALVKIREAISASSSGSAGAAAEPAKPQSIVMRKIGDFSGSGSLAPNPEGTTMYSFFPSWLFSWKTMLVALLVFAIIWVIRPYISLFNTITDSVKSLMQTGADVVTDTSSDAVDSTKKGSKAISDKVSGKKKPKASLEDTDPKPDESASSVQGGAQGGFCLAGEWKGVRSCVKVDSAKDCTSGQLFPSETACVNPTLRS